jgi:hypothetical protein
MGLQTIPVRPGGVPIYFPPVAIPGSKENDDWVRSASQAINDAASAVAGAVQAVKDAICPDECPPCRTVSGRIVPVGTIAFRPLDSPPGGKVEHGIVGPHFNIYKANQAPRNSPQSCKCFWQPMGAVTPSALSAGAIPIEPFAN